MERVMMKYGLCIWNTVNAENRLPMRKEFNVEGKCDIGCHLTRFQEKWVVKWPVIYPEVNQTDYTREQTLN